MFPLPNSYSWENFCLFPYKNDCFFLIVVSLSIFPDTVYCIFLTSKTDIKVTPASHVSNVNCKERFLDAVQTVANLKEMDVKGGLNAF